MLFKFSMQGHINKDMLKGLTKEKAHARIKLLAAHVEGEAKKLLSTDGGHGERHSADGQPPFKQEDGLRGGITFEIVSDLV
ncbi:MAG: hypothetical protein JRD04_12730, partial [Deltaproteobacteria bacterium]|nr:hypothetical protein [Deltaproteobacteria bacterium]